MKTLITLLLSCLPVLAANRAVVVSTSTNAVIAPTTFGLQLLTNANAGELLSLIGAVTETNTAQLNQSQTWTGTPTFPATVFSSNSIAYRLLWSSPTNINIASAAVAAVGSVTNQGDFVNTTSLAVVTVPRLLGSNSYVLLGLFTETPAQSSACNIAVYAGSSTNYVGSIASGISGTIAQRLGGDIQRQNILANAGSYTNQLQGNSLTQQAIYGPTNFCGTDTNFTLYFGAFTTTSATNINIRHFKLIELVSD